jgi:hypothetical protein
MSWANLQNHRQHDTIGAILQTTGKFSRRAFLFSFKVVVFARAFASRLDVTRIRHSGGHAQKRQHPTHQHDVACEERNEPQPVRHKLHPFSAINDCNWDAQSVPVISGARLLFNSLATVGLTASRLLTAEKPGGENLKVAKFAYSAVSYLALISLLVYWPAAILFQAHCWPTC